jgi:hypothetical protein
MPRRDANHSKRSSFSWRRRTLCTGCALVVAVGVFWLSDSSGPRSASATEQVSTGRRVSAALSSKASRRVAHPSPRHATTARPALTSLADLERTAEQRKTLWLAEQSLVRSCMRGQGFDYAQRDYDDSDDQDHAFSKLDPTDVDAARAVGYGLAEDIAQAAQAEASEPAEPQDVRALDPEQRTRYRTALLGPDVAPDAQTEESGWDSMELPGGVRVFWFRDSCYQRAYRSLYGTDLEHNELGPLASQLEARSAELTRSHPAYVAALGNWRKCMARRGFHDPEPGAAAQRLAERYHAGRLDLASLRAAEIEAASADAACRQGVLFDTQVAQARAQAATQTLAENHEFALSLHAEQVAALARAERLLKEEAESDEQ